MKQHSLIAIFIAILFSQTLEAEVNNISDKDINSTQDSSDKKIHHDYVNLDLPSGTLWATCNVGTNKPEACGFFFAWGETSPKKVYNWSTYIWTNDDGNTFTKYIMSEDVGIVDNKEILDPDDDAASFNWGDNWRMPTKEEFSELFSYCNSEKTSDYNGTGVSGILLTSQINGRSIFLPSGGYIINSFQTMNAFGDYWTSSICDYHKHNAYFYEFALGNGYLSGLRYIGRLVRPVFKAK